LRRRLELKEGQAMKVRSGKGRKVVFTPADEPSPDVETMLAQAHAWFAKTRQDPVKDLHIRRQTEREREVRR
jgi:hypothetical protein